MVHSIEYKVRAIMKDKDFMALKNSSLLEKYVKVCFLIDFYQNAWFRWIALMENASESVDILDGIIDRLDGGFPTLTLEEYKSFYEDAATTLESKTERLIANISSAEDRKSVLFAEICRRDLSYEVSRFQEAIEDRTKYYHYRMEGDL